jgi:radical SAM superfamily enzyme YgiQ (UPF0313 family)
LARAPKAHHPRRVLCVFPSYAPSFGTFQHAYPLMAGVRAFMPPQGLLVLAAYLPDPWEVRLVDENIRPASDADFAWAEIVMVSGMHIQRSKILDIARRAKRQGCTTVLGGPSVSGEPDAYGAFDFLHIGELGDATDEMIRELDDDPSRPPAQRRFMTRERLPLTDFPIPAYGLLPLERYFIGSLQFSSGCPYRCEFCDIPALYGRVPRLKTPEQVVAELDAMVAQARPNAVYFVDDNFIGNRKATARLLPALIEWQRRNGYPLEFACEATLNIAKQTEILGMMREAGFATVFCGIESPDLDALQAMDKGHNGVIPIIEAVETLNAFGMEVVAGIILGLDTDTPATPAQVLDFINHSQIPMLTINLLQALPRTPLWDRMAAEGRLVEDSERESNVVFRLPYERVVEGWKWLVTETYKPEAVYGRFLHQVARTFPNRFRPSDSRGRATWRNIRKGLSTFARILLHVGLLGSYRRAFWRMAWPLLKRGDVESMIHVALVSHHLIRFANAAAANRENASFYSAKHRTVP